jgi:CBS domain-containing protein
MFAVSGIGGELFRGPLEELLETPRIAMMGRTRGVGRDGDEVVPDADLTHANERRYQAAALAYSSALKTRQERGPIYHAYQIMSRDVLTVRADASVESAWRALEQRGVGQAPVLDKARRIVGLVSRANLLHVLNEEDGQVRDVRARAVSDVMSTPVVTADPVSEVRRIARVLLECSLPAVPVVDPGTGELVGIVSRGDILRVVVTDPPLSLWG